MAVSGSIKGITIELGADTTKLSSALNSANRSIKSTQKDLTAVNKALKLDPGNTALLGDKFRLLGQKIGDTKTKLDALKQAQAKLDAQGVDKNSKEYKELQTEINLAESELKQLNAEAKKLGSEGAASASTFGDKMQSAGEKLKGVGSNVESVGRSVSKVSAVSAAILGGSVASFKSLKEGYDTVAKGTGATGKALEDLKDVADEVYGSMATDMDTVGTGVADLNTRFGFTGDTLEEATRAFIQFADVNNTDVSTAIQNVSRYMGDAGIESSKYGEVLDTLTKASQNSGISVDRLSESLTKYGAPMRALGFDTKESIAIFSQWEKAGVNTEIAFSGMKKAISNWAGEGKDAREEFKKTLAEIAACPDIASATTKAIEVFGSKAGPDLADAIKGGRFAYEDFLNLISDSEGTLTSTYEATQDGTDKAKVAFNNLKLAAAELGATVMETAAPMLEKLTSLLQSASDKFGSMSPASKKMIVSILAIVAALGPVLIVVGKLMSSVGTIMSVAPKLAGGLKLVAGAVGGISAPVVAIVAAIGALVGAFVYLWNTNSAFKSNILETWNEIKETLSGFFQGIVDRLNELGFNFKDITDVLKAVWDGFCQILAPVFDGAFQIIAAVLKNVLGVLTGVLDVFIGIFTGNWDQVWKGVNEIFQGMWEGVKGFFQGILTALKGITDVFLGWFGTSWSQLWTGVSTFFASIWNSIKSTASSVFNTIRTVASTAWNGVKLAITTPINVASTIVKSTINGIKTAASNTWNSIKSTASTVWNGIKSAITSPIETARSVFTNAISAMRNALNFNWRLPDLKIPHISVSGGEAPFGIGGKGSLPSFNVDWYDKGGIFNSPTIIGVGEKRPEFVGALDDLRKIVREESGGGGQLIGLMTQLVDEVRSMRSLSVTQNIYADNTSYSGQQRKAAQEMQRIARLI